MESRLQATLRPLFDLDPARANAPSEIVVPFDGKFTLNRDTVLRCFEVRDVDYRHDGIETGEPSAAGITSGVAGYAWLAGGGLMVEAVKGKQLFVKRGDAKFAGLNPGERMQHPLQSGDVIGLVRREWEEAASQWKNCKLFRFEVVLPSPSPATVTSAPAAEEEDEASPAKRQRLSESEPPSPPLTNPPPSEPPAAEEPPLLLEYKPEPREEEVSDWLVLHQQYQRFDGRKVHLNRLMRTDGTPVASSSSASSSGPARMAEISRQELLWDVSHLQHALFTSFGIDYYFLSELIKTRGADKALSPAAAKKRGVIAVDNYDHHRTKAGVDEETYTIENPAVGAYISVVMPPFYSQDDAITTAERTRMHHGTMHPKLWLLEFDTGGHCNNGFLRLVISSANLGRYDAQINNQFYAIDFVRKADAMQAVRELGFRAVRDELRDEWRVETRGLEKHELCEALLTARREGSQDFKDSLYRFVRALLFEPMADHLYDLWEGILDRYEITPPAGTHLIISVPGRYLLSREKGKVLAEAEHYGLHALRRHLRDALKGREDVNKPTIVEYASSSMGQLKDIMWPFLGLRPPKDSLKKSEKDYEIQCGALLEGAVDPPGKNKKAYCVWPSLATSLPAFAHGTGLLTIGGGQNTMTGPSDQKCEDLRRCMANNVTAAPERGTTLHHVKMAAGTVYEPGRTAKDEAPPLCAWIYAGSHNLSAAAWGKIERRQQPEVAAGKDGQIVEAGSAADDVDDFDDEWELVCMAYEVGVLLLPPKPIRHALPWRSPAEPYDPTIVRPFSSQRFLKLLHGRESRKGGDAQKDAEECAKLVCKEWESVKRYQPSLQGMRLPSLLKMALAHLKRLVEVEVKVADSVIEYAEMPEPGSKERKKARHFKRDAGSKDELLKLLMAGQRKPLPVGRRIKALRITDFSYGLGNMKGVNDPVFAVYEAVVHDPNQPEAHRYFDDFDRSEDPVAAAKRLGKPRLAAEVLDKEKYFPRGVLIAFLSSDDRNEPLLKILASAADDIDKTCWGALCLQPDEIDMHETDMHETTPSHADLLAREFGVDPTNELPALVLLTADLHTRLLMRKGEKELDALAASGAAELKAELQIVGTRDLTEDELKRRAKTSWYKRKAEGRATRAAEAAEWVRNSGYKLLLIEPEGILKKQCNERMITSATKAIGERRKSLFGDLSTRKDSFFSGCVPFLRHLLLDITKLPNGRDDYDPFSSYGDGPPKATLREDSPKIALVTNFGHLVSKTRPGEGEDKMLTEEKVREVLDKMMMRIASELGVEKAALEERISLFISFAAPGVMAPPALTTTDVVKAEPMETDAAQNGWSPSWAKPQPGMLHAALAYHDVEASEALMVGYDYVDEQAASNGGVVYVDQGHLIGVETKGAMRDWGFEGEDEIKKRLKQPDNTAPPRTSAPRSFATEKQANAAAKGNLPVPRSPGKSPARPGPSHVRGL